MVAIATASAYAVSAKLDRFEERYAVLLSDDMEGELHWPITKLPTELKPGDPVEVSVHSKQTQNNQQYENMRKLLEDLIN